MGAVKVLVTHRACEGEADERRSFKSLPVTDPA